MFKLSPQGHLACTSEADKKLQKRFAESQSAGLFYIATAKTQESNEPIYQFWQKFIHQYIKSFCHELSLDVPDQTTLHKWCLSLPAMVGSEYLTPKILASIWQDFHEWMQAIISEKYDGNKTAFIKQHLPMWHQVGRICFHLAENKQDEQRPFAFMATYAANVTETGRVKQLPLVKALQQYAGSDNKNALQKLLVPLVDAAKQCQWLNDLVNSKDIYHPLAWTSDQAYQLLSSVEQLQSNGLVVKLPNWWKAKQRATVKVSIGNDRETKFSAEDLLDFNFEVIVGGQSLTTAELDQVLNTEQHLMLLRGEWVEIDRDKLNETLNYWDSIKQNMAEDGLTFSEAMRTLSGFDADRRQHDDDFEETIEDWSHIQCGRNLQNILDQIREPTRIPFQYKNIGLQATLRPYQEEGVAWLDLLTELGMGACLADDMGLGKTIQIITLLLKKKHIQKLQTTLLILPASLLMNWQAELNHFAPSLNYLILHASSMPKDHIEQIANNQDGLMQYDLVITTYGMARRQSWLAEKKWGLVILDEAHAIKNAGAQQSRAIKKIKSSAKIALTGTPIENNLSDLWSLFDYICPGLLGLQSVFSSFMKADNETSLRKYASLRQLIQPYILRRLKTDKKVINDLPEKVELEAWCTLSKIQLKYYTKLVADMSRALDMADQGIKRQGLVLSYLTRFKQLCNHPSHLLGTDDYQENESGKFRRLREVCEEIAAKQEKVLVFTQYREMIEPLRSFLETIFHEPGLTLHGGTAVKKRQQHVDSFQSEAGASFFVLSLKAAGVGLNLTAANHVIHFDRWWNPAIENQATDRAFRIGQKNNVIVHKFMNKGTIEEKVDTLIKEKTTLVNELLEPGKEDMKITALSNSELINLVSLDINSVGLQ